MVPTEEMTVETTSPQSRWKPPFAEVLAMSAALLLLMPSSLLVEVVWAVRLSFLVCSWVAILGGWGMLDVAVLGLVLVLGCVLGLFFCRVLQRFCRV